MNCTVCSSTTATPCGGCGSVSYCGKECQRKDWKQHKTNCKPYSIVYSEEEHGRHMRATRDIRAGEKILATLPACVGPRLYQPVPCCVVCYSTRSSLTPCSRCSMLVCSAACSHLQTHSAVCRIVARYSKEGLPGVGPLTPLLILALQGTDSNQYQTVMEMEDNIEEIKSRPLWEYYQENIIKPIMGLNIENVTVDIIEKIVGIILTNSFEVVVGGCPLIGLFFPPAMMNHDCVGNVRITLDNNQKMTVYACRQIKKNTPIKFNYVRSLDTTWSRQINLMDNKFFTCVCERCLDPAELGSHISSMKCREGECSGAVLPSNPLSMKQHWTCQSCDAQVKGEDVRSILKELQRETAGLNSNNLKEVMRVLSKFSPYLHPHHGVLTELKQYLVSGLGRLPGYTMADLSQSDQVQKLVLCRQVLEVLDIVDPGLSLGRGLMLYELHSTLVSLANMQYETSKNTAQLVNKLLEAESYLTEAAKILSVEPPNSPYGEIANNAKQSIGDLEQYIKSLQQQAMVA